MNGNVRQLKSYVFYEDKCFFVSTIERESSAAISHPGTFYETLVWEHDWGTDTRGDLIAGDGDGEAFAQHMRMCKALYFTGTGPEEQQGC